VAAARISTLEQLLLLSEEELLQLHGIGYNAIQQIKKALKEKKLPFTTIIKNWFLRVLIISYNRFSYAKNNIAVGRKP
jgi:DNA-directed RNA polymerase alpha subunit